jgi:hypothetical protein
MKLKVNFVIVISLLALNSRVDAASSTSTTTSGKQSRVEASEAAYKAKTAAEEAVEAADLAVKITAKEDFGKFSKDLKIAALKAKRAAKKAEAKAHYAYKTSLSANKSFVAKLVQDSRVATANANIALKKTETFLKRSHRSGDAELSSIESDIKRSFQESADSAKKVANTASEYVEAQLNLADSDFLSAVNSTKEFTREQKNEIENGYHRDLSKLDDQMAIFESQLKTKSTSVKVEFNEQVSNLKKQRGELNERLERLAHADGFAWKDLKLGMDSAFKDIKVSFQKASSDFKKE